MALYFWRLISIDYGSGVNRFDKDKGFLSLSRRGFLKDIEIEIPINEIKAVKLEAREGFNPRRRVCLRIKGKKDLPISRVGAPKPLLELEKEGVELHPRNSKYNTIYVSTEDQLYIQGQVLGVFREYN